MSKSSMFNSIDGTEYKRFDNGRINEPYANFFMYEEYTEKADEYSKEDWDRILARGEVILKRIAGKMDKEPSDKDIQEDIDEFKQYINDNFYGCTTETFRVLGERYIHDELFASNIEKFKPGLANFLGEAILIYCA